MPRKSKASTPKRLDFQQRIYGDCEIVTLVIRRDELATLPVTDYSKLQK